jgi:Family of unknown function (DUF6069)
LTTLREQLERLLRLRLSRHESDAGLLYDPEVPGVGHELNGLPAPAQDILRKVKIDFAPRHRQPAWGLVGLATFVSIVGSLLADALLVKIGTAVFPSTKGFVHFQFPDYAKLTILGVLVACAAWPVVTRITSAPRWVFFRMAILVTLVLWLPDLYILAKGEPAKAVAILMVMHLAVALVTYNALVHIAPVRRLRHLSRAG